MRNRSLHLHVRPELHMNLMDVVFEYSWEMQLCFAHDGLATDEYARRHSQVDGHGERRQRTQSED